MGRPAAAHKVIAVPEREPLQRRVGAQGAETVLPAERVKRLGRLGPERKQAQQGGERVTQATEHEATSGMEPAPSCPERELLIQRKILKS
jgi:hypothetical protein